METKAKIILPPLVAALVLTGCRDSVQPRNGQQQIKAKEITNQVFLTQADLFEIEDGVLVRYHGDYSLAGEIILPKEVKEIGSRAFLLSKKLRERPIGMLETLRLTIPKGVKLQQEAFYGSGPLEITLEEGREYVEKHSFYDCTKYHTKLYVKVPDSVKVIEEHAFDIEHGGWLTVDLGDGVEILEKYALQGACCGSIPSSVREIAKHAMGDWGRLPHDLPEGVRYLERHFIDLLHGTIKIPASVRHIEVGAVKWEEGAIKLGYKVDPANKNYRSDQNGWLYSKDGKTLYFAYSLNGQDILIPDSVDVVYTKGLVRDEGVKVYGLSRVKRMD